MSQPPTSLSKPDQPGLEVWFFSPPPNFPYELFAGVHAEQMLIWKEIYNFLLGEREREREIRSRNHFLGSGVIVG